MFISYIVSTYVFADGLGNRSPFAITFYLAKVSSFSSNSKIVVSDSMLYGQSADQARFH